MRIFQADSPLMEGLSRVADLVLLDGDPLKLESEVVLVVGSGRIVVDRR